MYSYKKIWAVTYPILLGLLAQNIINVTDTAFLGRLGEIPLGASAMGGLLYICVATVAFGFSVGAQIMIGRRNGEGNHRSIGTIMWQGCLFSLLMGALFVVLSLLFSHHLLRLLISTDEVFDATVRFFDWRLWGIPFCFLNVMFRAFYVGITDTKVLTITSVVMAGANVLLDYALIFGHWGFPALGIEGAAIASVIAEGVSLLFSIGYIYVRVDRKRYGLDIVERPRWGVVRGILSISTYTMLQYFLLMAVWFVFFIAIERQGSFPLAISNIIRSLYAVILIPVHALSTTASTLVSNMIGEGKTDKVFSLLHRIACLSLGVMAIILAVVALFPRTFLSIYTDDPVLIEGSVSSLYVLLIALMVAPVSNIYFNGILGTGAARASLIIEVIVQAIYGVYIVVVGMWLFLPIEICFTTEAVYYVAMLIISLLYLKYGQWRYQRL